MDTTVRNTLTTPQETPVLTYCQIKGGKRGRRRRGVRGELPGPLVFSAMAPNDDGFRILLAIAFASAGPKNKTPKQPQHNKRDKRNTHTHTHINLRRGLANALYDLTTTIN